MKMTLHLHFEKRLVLQHLFSSSNQILSWGQKNFHTNFYLPSFGIDDLKFVFWKTTFMTTPNFVNEIIFLIGGGDFFLWRGSLPNFCTNLLVRVELGYPPNVNFLCKPLLGEKYVDGKKKRKEIKHSLDYLVHIALPGVDILLVFHTPGVWKSINEFVENVEGNCCCLVLEKVKIGWRLVPIWEK